MRKKEQTKAELAANVTNRGQELLKNGNLFKELLHAVEYFTSVLDVSEPTNSCHALLAWLVAMEEFGLITINEDWAGRPDIEEDE